MMVILKIILLLAVIIIPLRPQKNKIKTKSSIKGKADTKGAHYAINQYGVLEEFIDQ